MTGEVIEMTNAKKSPKRLAEDLAKKLQEAQKIDRARLDAELRVVAGALVGVLSKESGSTLWLGGAALGDAIRSVRGVADEYGKRAQLYDELLLVTRPEFGEIPF